MVISDTANRQFIPQGRHPLHLCMQTVLTGLVLGNTAASAFPSIMSSSSIKQAGNFQPRRSTYLYEFLGLRIIFLHLCYVEAHLPVLSRV